MSEEFQDMKNNQARQEANSTDANGKAEAPSEKDALLAQLEAQLSQARQEAADNWNRFLRERAEMDNFRKRQERLTADRVQSQKKAMLQKFLGVQDNVERALIYQETMDRQGLQQALRMMQWQLGEVLRGEGLTPWQASARHSIHTYMRPLKLLKIATNRKAPSWKRCRRAISWVMRRSVRRV